MKKALPAALVAAALFHALIDDPIQRWLTPRLKGKPSTPAPGAPAAA